MLIINLICADEKAENGAGENSISLLKISLSTLIISTYQRQI